ncbi:hypothetical protein HZH66_011896 [Vespula vulgaris]|uniref:Uncharacterized protein n=1 Tax=Vespula vulgaris TaxID=7454 RepID=A0A834JFD7_VESVU|nr:hypothetical protein HZH66_011896 [Vespula vulgaris]
MDQHWIEFAYGVESRSRVESRLVTLFAIGSSRSERVALGRSPFRVFSVTPASAGPLLNYPPIYFHVFDHIHNFSFEKIWFERTEKETYRFVERKWKIQRKRKIKNDEEEEKEKKEEKEEGDVKGEEKSGRK